MCIRDSISPDSDGGNALCNVEADKSAPAVDCSSSKGKNSIINLERNSYKFPPKLIFPVCINNQ